MYKLEHNMFCIKDLKNSLVNIEKYLTQSR